MGLQRETRLQIMLNDGELALVDDWRFAQRMPSRAAAIRQLITLGLQTAGYVPHAADKRSRDFAVTVQPEDAAGEQRRLPARDGNRRRNEG